MRSYKHNPSGHSSPGSRLASDKGKREKMRLLQNKSPADGSLEISKHPHTHIRHTTYTHTLAVFISSGIKGGYCFININLSGPYDEMCLISPWAKYNPYTFFLLLPFGNQDSA